MSAPAPAPERAAPEASGESRCPICGNPAALDDDRAVPQGKQAIRCTECGRLFAGWTGGTDE